MLAISAHLPLLGTVTFLQHERYRQHFRLWVGGGERSLEAFVWRRKDRCGRMQWDGIRIRDQVADVRNASLHVSFIHCVLSLLYTPNNAHLTSLVGPN